jgi:hypothetical protein
VRDHEEEWLELCRQASVEQDGEKLFHLVRRINELLEDKARRLKAGSVKPVSKDKRIFQIAYDERLFVTREELLKNRGYEVKSVLGNHDAKHSLDGDQTFRLFIVGHNASRKTREETVRWLKTKFSKYKGLGSESTPHESWRSRQRRIAPCTDRKCSLSAAPTGYLRRDDGLHLSGERIWRSYFDRRMAGRSAHPGVAGRELKAGGCGNLGSARRATRISSLALDVLGSVRTGFAACPEAFAFRAT